MPDAKVCSCNDVASNHRTTSKLGEDGKRHNIYHECLVDECKCEQFTLAKIVNPSKVNYI